MEIPGYLRVIWRYKWALLAGMLLAVTAGVFTGYSLGPDGLESRAVRSYTATTTLLLTSAKDTLYQAEIPAREIPEGYTAPQSIDLTNTAVIYAYIISGSGLRDTVMLKVGDIDPLTESISAVRRTTQPGGNERFPGNLRLPVIDIIATAATPDRANELTAATTASFLDYVKQEQDRRKLKEDERVQIAAINVGDAVEAETSNPNVPVVFTAFGVMVAVLALVFAIHGYRTSRQRKREADAAAIASGSDGGEDPEDSAGTAGSEAADPADPADAAESDQPSPEVIEDAATGDPAPAADADDPDDPGPDPAPQS